MKVWEGRTINGGERVAIGREVEITGRRRNDTSQGTQRKTPSLDDVLKSIRGLCECNTLSEWCTIQPPLLTCIRFTAYEHAWYFNSWVSPPLQEGRKSLKLPQVLRLLYLFMVAFQKQTLLCQFTKPRWWYLLPPQNLPALLATPRRIRCVILMQQKNCLPIPSVRTQYSNQSHKGPTVNKIQEMIYKYYHQTVRPHQLTASVKVDPPQTFKTA